jgi:hypothetical protein
MAEAETSDERLIRLLREYHKVSAALEPTYAMLHPHVVQEPLFAKIEEIAEAARAAQPATALGRRTKAAILAVYRAEMVAD